MCLFKGGHNQNTKRYYDLYKFNSSQIVLILRVEYYNLDSKLAMPELIGDEAQLVAYLEHIAKSKDNEIILVVPKEVELSGTWKL